jgi:hypothetical protein
MKKTSIPFAELRRFLLGLGLGYREGRTENAIVFHRAKKDMLIFRLYRDEEDVDLGDLLSTRRYLDLRGLLDEAEFDAFLERATTPA